MADRKPKSRNVMAQYAKNREVLAPPIISHHDPEMVANLSKTDPAYGHIVKEVSEFRDNGLRTQFPAFLAQENKLSNALDDIDAQIKNITELSNLAHTMLDQFANESIDTKHKFETHLQNFQKWDSPTESAKELQEKVIELKSAIKKSRKKLAKISDDVTTFEHEYMKSGQTLTAMLTIGGIVFLVIAILVYMYIF